MILVPKIIMNCGKLTMLPTLPLFHQLMKIGNQIMELLSNNMVTAMTTLNSQTPTVPLMMVLLALKTVLIKVHTLPTGQSAEDTAIVNTPLWVTGAMKSDLLNTTNSGPGWEKQKLHQHLMVGLPSNNTETVMTLLNLQTLTVPLTMVNHA